MSCHVMSCPDPAPGKRPSGYLLPFAHRPSNASHINKCPIMTLHTIEAEGHYRTHLAFLGYYNCSNRVVSDEWRMITNVNANPIQYRVHGLGYRSSYAFLGYFNTLSSICSDARVERGYIRVSFSTGIIHTVALIQSVLIRTCHERNSNVTSCQD